MRKTKTLTGKLVSPFGPVAGAAVVVVPQGREGGGRATTDPAGGWSVAIPERTESAMVVASAPGSGLKAFDVVTEGGTLALEVTAEQGTLELALPYTAAEVEKRGLALQISQDGLEVPTGLLAQWADGHGEVPMDESDRTRRIPALAPGTYRACLVRGGPALGAATAVACDAGTLANGGTLRLQPAPP